MSEITALNVRENRVCLGTIVTFNCVINSSMLVWFLNDDLLYVFPTINNAARRVGSYAALLSDDGGILNSSFTLTSIPDTVVMACSNGTDANTLPLTVLTGKA